MIKLALVTLCACHPATTPGQPIAPVPEASPAPVWPAYPDIAAPPASHPSGDPIRIPLAVPRVGETIREIATSSFEIHYTFPTGTKYQLTETATEVRVKTLEANGDRATKLEVDTVTATESIALGATPDTATRDQDTLFDGTYVVRPGHDGDFTRDLATVTRPDGRAVYGRDQEELASAFGPRLVYGHPFARLVAATPLRLGEASAVDPKALDAKLPGAYTLAIVALDASSATYQLDIVSKRVGALGPVESHSQATLHLERATGRVLDEHEVERETQHEDDGATEDKFSTRATRYVP